MLKENPPAGFWANRPAPRTGAVAALVAAAGVPRADPKEKPPELVTGALYMMKSMTEVTYRCKGENNHDRQQQCTYSTIILNPRQRTVFSFFF